MSSCTVCLLLILMATSFVAMDATKVVYLRYNCDKTITVDGDVLISLNPWFQRSCRVTILAKHGSQLRARFTDYHFSSSKSFVGYIDGRCTFESLQLGTDSEYFFDSNDGYCSLATPTRTYDLGTRGYFTYESRSILSSSMRADLLVTEVYHKTSDGKCADGQFDCDKNDYCISNHLTCNGYDNCGNDRDEIKGCGLTTPIIIGIVVGGICFVVLVIVIGVCVVKKLKH